jgi:hypothetical protein
MQPVATALGMTRQMLSDPALFQRSPGEELAWAASNARDHDVSVPIRAHLTSAFPLFATRPRYTVRHLMKMASVTERTLAYVSESHLGSGPAGLTYAAMPEAGFVASMEDARLTEVCVRVELPAGLTDHAALFAAFTDYRVLVRLGTVENESLLRGTTDGRIDGLLNLRGLRRARLTDDLTTAIADGAAMVEETGGSCDGITVHPAIYWELVRAGTLGKLGEVGVRVARTRVMPRDQVLLGDYRAAVTLLDPGTSLLTVRRKAGQNGGDVLEASTQIGLAVHLPQHFVLLSGDSHE